jgi:Ras-related C3 botulinum toxin substrate 1
LNKKHYFIQTNCFLLCFGIDNKTSFTNIQAKWIPELQHFAPRTNIVLVGTKSDLRVEGSSLYVTEAEGKKLKAKIGAKSYVECSARTKDTLVAVFEEAVRVAESKTESVGCTIL